VIPRNTAPASSSTSSPGFLFGYGTIPQPFATIDYPDLQPQYERWPAGGGVVAAGTWAGPAPTPQNPWIS